MKTTKRVTDFWSVHNLPTELLLEILTRLPVKSLLRFRCVLKSWRRSMIDDPEFRVLHFKKFKNNCDETHLLVVQHPRETQSYVVRKSHTFQTPKRLDYIGTVNGCCPTLTASHLEKGWRALCSVDGLVMMKHLTTPVKLILWNPSIRRARTLAPSPTISEGMLNVDLGFGYNPLLKDYQHVRFVQAGPINLHMVAIYTFGLGTWKTIKFQGISNWLWCFPEVQFQWETVCLRGVIYFTAKKLHSKPQDLIAFDLRDGVFASTSLPVDDDLPSSRLRYEVRKDLLLLDDGNSLGVFFHVPTGGNIWVMESSKSDIVSKCWTKRYTFSPGIFPDSRALYGRELYYRHLKKNGDMILIYEKQLTSYNIETREEKILLASGCNLVITDVWGYKESLYLL